MKNPGYTIWRYMKRMAQMSAKTNTSDANGFEGVMSNTIRIDRLQILFIAAKVVKYSNRYKVKYSIHDVRNSPKMKFLKHLDAVRSNQGHGTMILPCVNSLLHSFVRQKISCT